MTPIVSISPEKHRHGSCILITELLNLFEVQTPKGSDASQAAQVRRPHHRGQWKPFQDAEETQGHLQVVAPPRPYRNMAIVYQSFSMDFGVRMAAHGCPANEDGVVF